MLHIYILFSICVGLFSCRYSEASHPETTPYTRISFDLSSENMIEQERQSEVIKVWESETKSYVLLEQLG
jgi:hypothetical protein